MSLQAVLNSVPRKSCGLIPVAVTCPGNNLQTGSSVRCFSNGSKLGLLERSNLRSHCLSSFACSGLPKSTFQLRNRSTRLQTAALQAVTADGDSSNGDGVGSCNHALNLSSVWSSQDSLISSLHGLQGRLTDLKEKGLEVSKKTAAEAYSRLKTGDAKSLFENIRWSEFVTQGARTWQSQEPWIKWPLAIFAAAFLVVWVSSGMIVAQDLIPLWIIGPLVTGSIIRGAFRVGDLTQKGYASTEALREAVMRGSAQVWEDAKNGELVDKLRQTMEQKNIEMKQGAAKRWSDFVLYVKSGQAAADFKVFLLLEFSRLNDWSTERYEDFAEWARPYWRAFSRLMKKLF